MRFIIIIYIKFIRPSKTDSVPVRGDGYEPESSKFRLRANAETSHSVRYDLVVVVIGIMGGGEKFLYRMVRSRKQPLSAPYSNNNNTILLSRHLYDLIWMRGIR